MGEVEVFDGNVSPHTSSLAATRLVDHCTVTGTKDIMSLSDIVTHNFSFCTFWTMVSSGTKRAAFEGKLYLKNLDCRLIEVYTVALFLASQVGRHISTHIRHLLMI